LLDRGAFGANRRHGRHLPLDHGIEDVGGLPKVDIRIARTGVLGVHGLALAAIRSSKNGGTASKENYFDPN
jgi:hypothetical protein